MNRFDESSINLVTQSDEQKPTAHFATSPGLLFEFNGFSIYDCHIECLRKGRLVNDLVIDFYLDYEWRRLPESRREKIYIFPSFFWTKLREQSTDDSRIMHDKVKRWTRNVDIFDKDFVFVPINEYGHWYLAIVCFPGLAGPVYDDDYLLYDEVNDCFKSLLVKEPRIIILDSLRNGKRKQTAQRLRDYLNEEWLLKRGWHCPRKFVGFADFVSTKQGTLIKGFYPVLPQQENGSDCGVFLLEYAERFMRDGLPGWKSNGADLEINDESKSNLLTWFHPIRGKQKRHELMRLFLKLAEKWRYTPLMTSTPVKLP